MWYLRQIFFSVVTPTCSVAAASCAATAHAHSHMQAYFPCQLTWAAHDGPGRQGALEHRR